MTDRELCECAKEALKNSYSPYSEFKVGAALLTKEGKIYLGCNIENSSFGATNCAERTAFFKAVSEGEKDFDKIAIIGASNGKIKDFCYPCGICRQVMEEFCESDFKIVLMNEKEEIKVFTLGDLLPNSFSKNSF